MEDESKRKGWGCRSVPIWESGRAWLRAVHSRLPPFPHRPRKEWGTRQTRTRSARESARKLALVWVGAFNDEVRLLLLLAFRLSAEQAEDLQRLVAGDKHLPIGHYRNHIRITFHVLPETGRGREKLLHCGRGDVGIERIQIDRVP